VNARELPRPVWTTGTTEAIHTGTWRAAAPAYRHAPSPCHLACPAEGRIPEWMQQAKAGDFFAAWTTLTDRNPFPAVTGRVCHRPCESACNRGGFDDPLAVRALEGYVGELALAAGWSFAQPPLLPQRVAIVGGGPSGLSAAYHLRRRGYGVTLFEQSPALGGLLRDGIPPYRLPRGLLDGEIARILALGVDVQSGVRLESSPQLLELRERYAAVYLAIGARRQKRLAQLDYVAPWVMEGAAYLAAANDGAPPALGRRVVVIGGGSAAMDVARSARRAGHEVSVLALEPEAQMPAQREEVVAAKAEGVRLFDGAVLVSASLERSLLLQCMHVGCESGDFDLEADALIPAIGQDPDLGALRPVLEVQGSLVRTGEGGATDLAGVFAGGDVATSERYVSRAIGMGRQAALAIDDWLADRTPVRAAAPPPAMLSAINTHYHPRSARRVDDPAAEAARCFSCGTCTQCDNCLVFCPDLAVRRTAGGYQIALEYCKGCALCVRECPTGSLAMQEERK
jgi:NADPH-dependent glutamate synthase beta subunit-like oxidoreductase/NAD-dependent dihydropyrimidine dehydrogenase PreA subunit